MKLISTSFGSKILSTFRVTELFIAFSNKETCNFDAAKYFATQNLSEPLYIVKKEWCKNGRFFLTCHYSGLLKEVYNNFLGQLAQMLKVVKIWSVKKVHLILK